MKKTKKTKRSGAGACAGGSKGDYVASVKDYYAGMACSMKPRDEKTFRAKIDFAKKHFPASCAALDAGCGNGYYTVELARFCRSVTAVDFSREMLSELRKTTKASKIRNVRIKQADITRLPFRNASFDAVACFSTFYYVREQRALLEEFSRVLKKGGTLVFDATLSPSLGAVYSKRRFRVPQFFVSRKRLVRELRSAGFEVAEERFFELVPKVGSRLLLRLLNVEAGAGGKTLDERVSSAPLLKRLAFRDLVACRKT